MQTNIGSITAKLSDTENNTLDLLLDKLHENIKPAQKIEQQDIHIRCMYIVSEEINSYGGKFPLEELDRIKELIIDSPVLIGHKRDQLPIGRNFHAEVVYKDNTHWVKCYFYWMKSAENADDLLANIDGGVIKECSIGFTFLKPECSVCGSDIRTCQHEVFESYQSDIGSVPCFFYYKQVENVLETSLVYRGANPNTSISDDLDIKEEQKTTNDMSGANILDSLDDNHTYLLTPKYIGVDVTLHTTQNSIDILTKENQTIPKHLIKKFFREYPKNLKDNCGQLIGFKGKERCSLTQLQKFLAGERSDVKHLELKLLPSSNILKSSYKNISSMRYRLAKKKDINKQAQTIMTKEGICLYTLKNLQEIEMKLSYKPAIVSKKISDEHYSFDIDANQNTILTLHSKDNYKSFKIQNFSQELFLNGSRFIAEKIDYENSKQYKVTTGDLQVIYAKDNCLKVMLAGEETTQAIIQVVIINAEEKYMLYKYS